MKVFIVALLVAAVAGQQMDMLKLKEKALLSKFNRPVVTDLLEKKMLGYPTTFDKSYIYGDNINNVDLPYTAWEDDAWEHKVLHIDEITSHPLFHEYLALPYFRQYWTYPAFQKYVTSHHFQRFWHIPAFKQYFVNPVLFYKYIYPIVNLYKTEFTIPTTDYYYGDYDNQEQLIKNDWIVNKNVFPVAAGFERDLVKDKYIVPTIYNQDLKIKDDLLAKTLLHKIYANLYNMPEELVKERFFNTFNTHKTIDPITGEWKYTTGYPFVKDYNTYNTFDKDVLFKKHLFNKMITKDEITVPEMIYREKMMTKMNPVVRRMLGYNTKFPTFTYGNKFDTTFEPTFDRYNMFDITMKKDLFKNELLTKDLVKDEILKDELIKDEILKKEYLKDEILKKELLKDKILFNKFYNEKEIDTFEPKVVEFNTPMMGVRTFDKKVFPETIIKA